MDDPIHTYKFIKDIIEVRKNDIVGLAIAKGNRLTIRKNQSKIKYLFSLLLIMGPYHFFINSITTILHKFKLFLSKHKLCIDPTIANFAHNLGIKSSNISNPNDPKFIKYLNSLKIDIIINQSQCLLKKDLLSVPALGVLNRHNALLPKNRGRLTPFWVLYKGEKETGVSIHFVEEGLDSGDIIIQKKFLINKNDDFNSVVKKNYKLASKAMIEAIQKIQDNDCNYIENDDNLASYNTIPTLTEALKYRFSLNK